MLQPLPAQTSGEEGGVVNWSLLRILWAKPYTEEETEARGGEGFLQVLSGLASEPGLEGKGKGPVLALAQKGGERALGGVWCGAVTGVAACWKPGAPGFPAGGAPLPLVGFPWLG